LNECDLKQVEKVFAAIIEDTEKETKLKAVKEARNYILLNRSGIVRYREDPCSMGCSAEGHWLIGCRVGVYLEQNRCLD
jgi:hypothetical protein